ncbi:MAG: hypothetical protein ACK4FW_09030 [Stenotrophomonas sp.]
MATCKYCGQAAGFLRYSHKDCDQKFNEGRSLIASQAMAALRGDGDFERLRSKVAEVGRTSLVPPLEQQKMIASAWISAVDQFLEDGLLDAEEEKKLATYKEFFLLNDADLDKSGALTKTVKAGVLRDLVEGKIPQRVSVEGGVGLNLQKGEQIIWAFPQTEYLEDKTKRTYVGRSHGVSVRVMKGVYYRTGAFKGHPVEHTERVSHGAGLMVLTNKHIYYHGAKAFRIPFSKIVSYEPFSNGIGVTRDAANAKMQSFVTGDGWFTYNIISNISNL